MKLWSRIAAVLLLPLILLVVYKYVVSGNRPDAMREISTTYGCSMKTTLPDGSVVWLNANSMLKYPSEFKAKHRDVDLKGEAYFDVHSDAKHPFIVETYACDVEVLGTKFNIMAEERNGLFATALFEGRVAVTNRIVPGERLMLEPDEVVTLEGEHLCRAMIGSDEEYMWTNGIIGLTGQTFAELMHRFEKTFGVTIRIEREPSIRMGQGKIRQSVGIDNALEVLRRFGDFEYVKDEQSNTITIR